jgi:hypothetical protein
MPVKPRENETESQFMSRCVPKEIEAGHEQQQAVAICYTYWRDKKGAYMEEPKKPRKKPRKK